MVERVPVSCYIRALNEQGGIARVIASVRGIVGEIVVVDSGSTDATVALARAEGARVVHQDWLGNGRQKRFGEDQCRNDFLLDLDADEIVTPELADEIRALFATGSPSQPIYELKLVTAPPVGEPWWNSGVVYRKKLYDRRIVRAPDHKVWDQFEVPKGIQVGPPIGCLAALFFSGPEASGGEAEPREHRSRQGYARARDVSMLDFACCLRCHSTFSSTWCFEACSVPAYTVSRLPAFPHTAAGSAISKCTRKSSPTASDSQGEAASPLIRPMQRCDPKKAARPGDKERLPFHLAQSDYGH